MSLRIGNWIENWELVVLFERLVELHYAPGAPPQYSNIPFTDPQVFGYQKRNLNTFTLITHFSSI